MPRKSSSLRYALLATFLCALPTLTRADLVFSVNLDTSGLNPTSSYTLAFDLSDGDPLVNNSVLIDSFNLGGGTYDGSPSAWEGGSATSTPFSVTLLDTSFFNSVEQSFFPGSSLSFVVTLSANFVSVQPDAFAFQLLDANGDPLGTGFAGEVLSVSINSNSPDDLVINSYAGIDNPSTGEPLFGEPNVTVGPAVVPEPSTLLAASVALAAGLGSLIRRHRQTCTPRRTPAS